jgi:hypothetical protein
MEGLKRPLPRGCCRRLRRRCGEEVAVEEGWEGFRGLGCGVVQRGRSRGGCSSWVEEALEDQVESPRAGQHLTAPAV